MQKSYKMPKTQKNIKVAKRLRRSPCDGDGIGTTETYQKTKAIIGRLGGISRLVSYVKIF